jgi:hypothetical protein
MGGHGKSLISLASTFIVSSSLFANNPLIFIEHGSRTLLREGRSGPSLPEKEISGYKEALDLNRPVSSSIGGFCWLKYRLHIQSVSRIHGSRYDNATTRGANITKP